MLESLHFLLSYNCNFECEHCFLHCGPGAGGTFRIEQIRSILDQAVDLGTIKSVCFEGGEPMLYFPLLLESIREARVRGFDAGIVTNAYWATSVADAALWLKPLLDAGVKRITMSDDSLHYGASAGGHAQCVQESVAQLGMGAGVISVEPPTVTTDPNGGAQVCGGVMFRGRAAERLTGGLPRRPWESLCRCTHEKLDAPSRVHVDSFGNVHLCQGLSMGNLWIVPLKQMVAEYAPQQHPIAGPLLRGGPAQLVREYGLPHEEGYVDECHLCYAARKSLRVRFKQELSPAQAYGVR